MTRLEQSRTLLAHRRIQRAAEVLWEAARNVFRRLERLETRAKEVAGGPPGAAYTLFHRAC